MADLERRLHARADQLPQLLTEATGTPLKSDAAGSAVLDGWKAVFKEGVGTLDRIDAEPVRPA